MGTWFPSVWRVWPASVINPLMRPQPLSPSLEGGRKRLFAFIDRLSIFNPHRAGFAIVGAGAIACIVESVSYPRPSETGGH